MADCLPSARTCSLVSVVPPQTLLWTVRDKVSAPKGLRKRSRPSSDSGARRRDRLGRSSRHARIDIRLGGALETLLTDSISLQGRVRDSLGLVVVEFVLVGGV